MNLETESISVFPLVRLHSFSSLENHIPCAMIVFA